jgi:AcrR family transcriptional regulator
MKTQVKFAMRARRAAPSSQSQANARGQRRSQSENRKREILRAALGCFTTIGFAGTTMADIRVRARASIGSIYHHFRSKEQLAAALYVEGLRDYQESFLAELDRRSRARDAVLALVRHHLQWIRKNPDLSRFLYDHRQSEFVTAAESAIKDLNEHFHRAGFSQWQRFVDKGEMIELPPDLLTAILLGPSQEFARHWLAGRTKTSLENAADVLAESAWRGLCVTTIKPRSRVQSTRRSGR